MSLLYLGCLLVAAAALVLLDRRFSLVFWRRPQRAALVIACGLVFFLAWDVLGIAFGVFARGRSAFMTGVELAPQLPLEEPVFLAFLCYLTLLLLSGTRELLDRRGQA